MIRWTIYLGIQRSLFLEIPDVVVLPLQAVWYLKAQALTEKNYVDDTEMDEEGAADLLLDENQMSSLPRYHLPRLSRCFD